MTTSISERVALLADRVGYEMHNFDCGNIDNTVIDPDTEEITTNFSIEQIIGAVTSSFNEMLVHAVDTAKSEVVEHANQAILLAKQEALLLAHPIGSYYWSSEPTEPSVLFGGEWEAVTDKFILASGSRVVGARGGDETHSHATSKHALTASEMPIHAHNVYIWDNNNSNYTAGAWTNHGTSRINTSSGLRHAGESWQSASFKTAGQASILNGSAFEGSGDMSGVTSQSGSGSAHSHGDTKVSSNMPPYEVAYCWRRTA